jgi:hypothetical protein
MAMATQTYATHRHQPRLTGVSFMFLVVAVVGFVMGGSLAGRLATATGLVGAIFTLQLISRRYTTALQDRIIKLEMRMRCASLLTPPQQAIVARLGKAQLVALRFAPDGELGPLVERAEREQMTADQIKRAITSWVPDLDRT